MNKDLVIGLEVHLQLNTGKLFCRCPVSGTDQLTGKISRRLKPTSGESGLVDRAAIYEEERSRAFDYVLTDNTCLVEIDEEPPRPMNPHALSTALKIAATLKCSILEDIECMRKIVIDGSNTSGFQRTSLIAMNGSLDTEHGNVRISSVCLEEDSARKIAEEDQMVKYSLGRLGIPLVEITTEPDIKSADHAIEVARLIGLSAMITGLITKNSDSIRQDVNLSMGYGRVEIKGISRLSQIKEAIESEVSRQQSIARASEIINKRGGFNRSYLEFIDVSDLFENTGSVLVKKGLSEGKRVFAACLENMNQTLKQDDVRMGQEIADIARAFSVGGVLHSDELPGYGIDESTVKTVSKKTGRSMNDGILLVITTKRTADILSREIASRITKLIKLDLQETRFFSDKGRTVYLRPLPGAERMYPETDVKPFHVTREDLKEAMDFGRLSAEERIDKISKDYGISRQDANTIVTNMKLPIFLALGEFIPFRSASRLILQKIPEVERKIGKPVDDEKILWFVQSIVKRGLDVTSVEAGFEILSSGSDMESIPESSEIVPLSQTELRDLIGDVKKNNPGIRQGSLMNEIRKKTRRPFDPKTVISIADL
jgi:glutamyl-tRNA(Gln) amidotransferase subunit E